MKSSSSSDIYNTVNPTALTTAAVGSDNDKPRNRERPNSSTTGNTGNQNSPQQHRQQQPHAPNNRSENPKQSPSSASTRNESTNNVSRRAPLQQQPSTQSRQQQLQRDGGGGNNDMRAVKLLSRNDPTLSQSSNVKQGEISVSTSGNSSNNVASGGLTIKPRKVVLPFPIGGDNGVSSNSSSNSNFNLGVSDMQRLQQQLTQLSPKLATAAANNNTTIHSATKQPHQQQSPQDSRNQERREPNNISHNSHSKSESLFAAVGDSGSRNSRNNRGDGRDSRDDINMNVGGRKQPDEGGKASRGRGGAERAANNSSGMSNNTNREQDQRSGQPQQSRSQSSSNIDTYNSSSSGSSSSGLNNNSGSNTYHDDVQKMIAAGGVRRQGIVITIKGLEFGFIKPVDQPDEIYFRLRDVYFPPSSGNTSNNNKIRETKETLLGSALLQSISPSAAAAAASCVGGNNTVNSVSEGDEISYFVTKENSKGGKLSDRAILLELLPKGTVQLEVTLAISVRGWVVSSPRALPKEEPGRIKLCVPFLTTSDKDVSSDGTMSRTKNNVEMITHVELWQRCLADGVICRVGDELELDVQRYRPENLLFARNVKVKQYFGLFRECGRVKRVVKEGGFAFVRSMNRSNDLYFRLSDVAPAPIATTGDPSQLQLKDIAIGTLLTFDVDADYSNNSNDNNNNNSNNNSNNRLKAVRTQLMSPALLEQFQMTSTGQAQLTDFHVFRKVCLHKIKDNVQGVVIRTTNERNERTDVYKTYGHIEYITNNAVSSSMKFYPSDAYQALETLMQLAEVKEMWIPNVTQSRITLLRRLLEETCMADPQSAVVLACEAESRGDTEASEGQALRVWRLSDAEREARAKQKAMENPSSNVQSSLSSPMTVALVDNNINTSDTALTSSSALSVSLPMLSRTVFSLIDIQDILLTACPSLPLTGLPVAFDLCYDRLDNKTIASNIRVNKAEYPASTTGVSVKKHRGVLECIRRVSTNNGGIYYTGLIRQVYTRQVFIGILPSSPPHTTVTIGTNVIPTTSWESGTLVNYTYSIWGDGVLMAENVEVELPPDVTATVARTWEKSATAVVNATGADDLLHSCRCVGMVVAENQLVFIERCGGMTDGNNGDSDVKPFPTMTSATHQQQHPTSLEYAQRQEYDMMQRISWSYWNASQLRPSNAKSHCNGFESVNASRNKASRVSTGGGNSLSATKGNANNSNHSKGSDDSSVLDKQLLQLLSSELHHASTSLSSSSVEDSSTNWHIKQQHHSIPSSTTSSPTKRPPSITSSTAPSTSSNRTPDQIWQLLNPLCVAPPCSRSPIPIRYSIEAASAHGDKASTIAVKEGGRVCVGELVYFTPVYDISGIASNSLIAALDPVNVTPPCSLVSTAVATADITTSETVGGTVAVATEAKKKVKGLISRIDVSLEAAAGISTTTSALMSFTPWLSTHSSHSNNNNSYNTILYASQLCEIRLVDSALVAAATSSVAVALASTSQLAAEAIYYCDIHEIICDRQNNNAGSAHQSLKMNENDTSGNGGNINSTSSSTILLPKVGDMVEFYPVNVTAPVTAVSILGLAVGVQLVPPPSVIGSVTDGIHFRPRPLAGVLTTGGVTSSTTAGGGSSVVGAPGGSGVLGGSTMAQGPPDNNGDNIGFVMSPHPWRPVMSAKEVMKFSWGHLLVSSYSTPPANANSINSGNIVVKDVTKGVSVLQVDAPPFTPATASSSSVIATVTVNEEKEHA